MADDDRWRFQALLATRGAETFRRMYLLEERGYRRDKGYTFLGDAIWYRHPRDGQPRIILYPDGKIVATGPNSLHSINRSADEGERDRIFNLDDGDAQIFDRWITSVRQPNAWQRTRLFREDVSAWGCIILLMVVSYAFVAWLVDAAKSLFGWH